MKAGSMTTGLGVKKVLSLMGTRVIRRRREMVGIIMGREKARWFRRLTPNGCGWLRKGIRDRLTTVECKIYLKI